jgi:hypothetical protein
VSSFSNDRAGSFAASVTKRSFTNNGRVNGADLDRAGKARLEEGVTPSLHVDYKHTRIKQYYKEGRALRTETTINDTRDFGIGKRLKNLPGLRVVGFQANRRLLDVQRISHDCAIGEDEFDQMQSPRMIEGQRVSGLRYAQERVQFLLIALTIFHLLPNGFSNRDLRAHLAALLGRPPETMTQGRMTYDLRRLRLHGLIERVPRSHRYAVTLFGFRMALFYTRTYARILRPGLADLFAPNSPDLTPLRRSFDNLDLTVARFCDEAKLAA